MTKEELFRKVLARDFVPMDFAYDYKMRQQMRNRDWIFNNGIYHSKYHPDIRHDSVEWQNDVIDALHELKRI